KRPDLAETLSRIRQNGASEMYTGETARMIAEYLDASGGLLTPEDLASFEPEWFTPLRATYHDLEVFALPPNTQGVALASEFTMMNELPMQEMGHNTPDYLHTLTEVIRLAVADRDSSVADPDYMRVSVEALLEVERLAAMAAGIDPSGNAYSENNADGEDHPNTVYLSVVDSEGNAVSLIQSLFASFGSGLVVPGTGVVLHNRGSLFTFDATHPNVFGPGRRPYHTLSPSMALKDGKPWLVFGTPGGDGQTHTLTQVMNNILLFGMTPQEAIDAPRIRRLASGALAIEDRMDTAVMDALEARGYTVRRRTGWTAEFGGAGAILIDPETGLRRAGADRRREGWSLAY
ncbi:MAG: gamma-glutamyltransferase family protein, partial [Gemmatimonadota bacterium]|nr:gamma-glutamyltransferase family protein [Gemmatimonadota bacterium]